LPSACEYGEIARLVGRKPTGRAVILWRMKGGRDHVSRNDVIISSSTEGSNKKFKISVDDTGAISATEV
jgi:hypothetical protein